MTEGRIHSIQSLGTLDGPGVRFVAFLQGCPLRCGCCHNPDTWDRDGGKLTAPDELVAKVVRYREYFGRDGGITLSGGEPLLQADFAREVFALCREQGIHTCLDTSGCLLNDSVRALLGVTDRVLLDIKYTNDTDYRRYVGCSLDAPLNFLAYLEGQSVPTTLRQVIIPSLNDTKESILSLRDIARVHACVDGVELLPFRKMCQVKYDGMGIDFPFGHLDEPSRDCMAELERLLREI